MLAGLYSRWFFVCSRKPLKSCKIARRVLCCLPAPARRCAANLDLPRFTAAKAGLRAMAQSLAREFQPQGIHVAHVVIDGGIAGEKIIKGCAAIR